MEVLVVNVGSAEQMQAIQDSLLQSDSDESSEEKVDDEPPKDSTELDDVALEVYMVYCTFFQAYVLSYLCCRVPPEKKVKLQSQRKLR